MWQVTVRFNKKLRTYSGAVRSHTLYLFHVCAVLKLLLRQVTTQNLILLLLTASYTPYNSWQEHCRTSTHVKLMECPLVFRKHPLLCINGPSLVDDLPESQFHYSSTAIVMWHSEIFLQNAIICRCVALWNGSKASVKVHADVSMRGGTIFCAIGVDLCEECCNILNSFGLVTHASAAVTCVALDTPRTVRNCTVRP